MKIQFPYFDIGKPLYWLYVVSLAVASLTNNVKTFTQKTYLPDLSFQSRNWPSSTVRPPFFLLFVPCAEVQKPVFVTFLRPGCFHFFASDHSPSDAFRRLFRMPFSAFSAISGLRQDIACGSETALRQVFRDETVFYGGFRKHSPKPLEQCYGSSGVLLRRSWSNATAAPEKPYGPSAKRPEGPCGMA